MSKSITMTIGEAKDPRIPETPDKKIILRRSRDLPYYFIKGVLSKSAIVAIEYATSFFVQNYQRTASYQMGDWNGKENLLYESSGGVRYFPAGLIDTVRGILDDFGVDYSIDIPLGNPLHKINVKWISNKVLYPDQDLAVDCGLTEPCGTICMPTGAGKTTVALKIVSELKVKTLILVHRRELLKQWVLAAKSELGFDVGVVGTGVEEWKDITVAMIQTICRRKDLNYDYDLLILDECFPYDTDVITDHGVLKIGDIVEGGLDVKVLTHTGQFKRILRHIRKHMPHQMVHVIHEFGEFDCTETHRILTNRGWIEAKLLLSGDVVYYTHDGRSKEIHLQTLREHVRYPRGARWAYCGCPYRCWSKQTNKSGILGFADTGTKTDAGSCHERSGESVAVRCETLRYPTADDIGKFARGYEYNVSHDQEQIPEIIDKSLFGASRVCGLEMFDSEEFSKDASKTCSERGVGENKLFVPHHIATSVQRVPRSVVPGEEECGYRGVFITNNITPGVSHMVPGRWVSSCPQKCRLSKGVWSQCYNFLGEPYGRGMQFDKRLVDERMGICVPFEQKQEGDDDLTTQERKCTYVPGGREYSGSSGLHEVQDDAGLYVYDIEVEDDHSYTANGVVVHNCHHTPAKTAFSVSMKCNATFRLGLSATPNRADGADLKLFAAVGGVIYKSRPEELVALGRLARPEFQFLPTSYVRNIHQGMPFHKIYTLGITMNEDRNDRIVRKAEKLLDEGYVVYVHVEEVDHGKYLAGHIEGSAFISGTTKKSERDFQIAQFSTGKLRCLVSTLLGEGVDIPSITAIIMAGGRKTEIGCIQKIGRALRAAPGKEKAIIVDMMDKGIYLSDHWQERYRAYKEYYGVYCPDLGSR